MPKNPAFQFYPRDWLSDTELQQASASTRGIWINLLSHMWFSQKRGEVSGPIEELRRLAGCTESEWLIFYEQNCRLKFADVTFSDGNVTVKNRRMVREERERNLATCRKSRQRSRECHAEVTPPSPSPSPSPPPSPTTKTRKTLAPVVDKSTPWADTLDDVRTFLLSIQAPDQFFKETYWLRIDQWLGDKSSQIYYFEELKGYLAWCASQNGAHQHKDQLRGFRNWLSTTKRWKERDAQRSAIRGG